MALKEKNAKILLFLAIVLSIFMVGCQTNEGAKTGVSSSVSKVSDTQVSDNSSGIRKIIIDTDTGADDSSAIILAAKNKNVDILGITTLVGNVDLEQSVKNAKMALELAGCDAPVYRGASINTMGEKIEAFSVFGSDGMGEAGIVNPKGDAEDSDAILFILETVKKYPNEVEIVAVGPATNIALAIEKDPVTMKKVKRIWSMGTTGLGPGNASPVAEFNVYADPLAYKIMLDSGIDITVVGLDMCGDEAQWTDEQFKKLEINELGQFVAASFGKIREFYALNGSEGSVMNCDTVAMTCALYPDFVKKTIKCHGSCIVDKGETFGQVIFYKEGFHYDVVSNDYDYNVTLVTEVDKANYFNTFLSAIK